MTTTTYTPGPGDAATFPPFAGHPNDPRGPTDWSADAALEHYRREFMELAADPKTGARFVSDEMEDVDMHDVLTKLFRDAAHEYRRTASLTQRAAMAGAAVFGRLQAYADDYARRRVAEEREAMEENRNDT